MAHERLSPRQKMIGMMYLVLTAMLALNVSKEAVKAFMKVEEGLSKTVKNYEAKNREIYDLFEQKYAENPVRGGPARSKAFNVKARADELFNYIQNLKIEVIRAGEPESKAINGKDITISLVLKYDDTNTPSQVLIGAKEDGKAFALRAAINDFRDSMLLIIGGKNPAIEESIRASLSTADGKKEDKKGTPEAWPNNQFQTLPVVAVIALLSKIQVDVRNAETDVITFLYNEIDKKSFKFNRLVPTVVPVTSTYVMAGNEYEARIFFAAVDTTNPPNVYVGDVVTNGVNPDGTPKYEMVGKEGTNYQKLDYDEAQRGVYKIRPTGIGQHKWGGLISMKAPDGSIIARPFTSNYEVGVENVVISPTAMNIFYKGIPNPVDISVPGVGPDKISATAKNGKISKGKVPLSAGGNFRGEWIVTPDQVGLEVEITVSAPINGKQKSFAPLNFRVKPIPKPEARFANKNSGKVDRQTALAEKGVFAVLEGFDFNLPYTITEFTVDANIQGQDFSRPSKSNVITADQQDLLKRVVRGKTFTINNIRVKYPDNSIQDIGAVVLTMN